MVSLLVSLLLFSLYLNLDLHICFKFTFQKRGGIFCFRINNLNFHCTQINSEYPDFIASQTKYYNKSLKGLQLYHSFYGILYIVNTEILIFFWITYQRIHRCVCTYIYMYISALQQSLFSFKVTSLLSTLSGLIYILKTTILQSSWGEKITHSGTW